MEPLRAVFKQTFWQIIGKGVSSISTFIILGIIARNYHEAGTGVFTLALTYLTMFNLLGDFGFNAHVLRKAQTDWQELMRTRSSVRSVDMVTLLAIREGSTDWRKLLGTRLVWSVTLLILSISLLLFLPVTTKDFSKAVIFGSLAIIGSSGYITCNLIFQAKLRYDLSVLASSLGTLVGLGVYIWLSGKGFPIPLLLTAFSLSWITTALFSLLLVKKFLPKITPIFNYGYIKHLFKDSWPIAATLALNVIYFRVDSFMIAYFNGVSDVGIYNVAYSVFQSVLVLPTFIMNAYYPLMLKSFKGFKLVALGLLVLAALATLLTQVFTPLVIKILTGGGFLGSTQSLQILSLGFPAYFLSSLLMWLMITKGKYKLMLVIYAIGLLFNLTANFIYIPQYSFLAASWTTVISEYLILLMQILSFKGILAK